MPLFLIEINLARKLQSSPGVVAEIREIKDQESIHWLISFLSMDQKKTFCLYETNNLKAVQQATGRVAVQGGGIIEIDTEMIPSEYQRRLLHGRSG